MKGQASVLLIDQETVTTSQFADAVHAFAEAYALYFLSNEWAMLKNFHHDLYRSFNPESKR